MFTIGIDMVEIPRIKESIKNPTFIRSFFGSEEIKEFEKKKFSPNSIAASFCSKEAFSKAMGTGFRGFTLKDVQLLHNTLGMPYIKLCNTAKEKFGDSIKEISVSLTHTENYACAVVICIHKI